VGAVTGNSQEGDDSQSRNKDAATTATLLEL